MIGGAMKAAVPDAVIPKFEPNPANGAGPAASGEGAAFTASYASIETESIHMKISNKDGDVVELDWEHREETFASVTFADARPGQPGSSGPGDAAKLAGANAEAAEPSATAADATSADARLLQLSRLREWAAKVAEEVRKQQKRILEETLKQSGKFMPGSEGRFIVIYAAADQAGNADGDAGDAEKGIPEYWNAENTSDRIVKFATQMAEIAGKDSDFAKTIVKAVQDGFDQANAATGPMPGAAGELNKKTRELTFAKLSKWLDDHKTMGYNQGARTEEIPNPDTTHGSENHEQ